MMKKASLTFACLLLLHATAAADPGLITGTFSKGPAVGGTQRFIGPNLLLIRGEEGFGAITGGVLTGSAVYKFKEELVDFATQIGTFDLKITITTTIQSSITLGLVGFISGVVPTAKNVMVHGTWVVLSASGPDSGLHGEGQFTGTENFETGETQGTFVGLIHTSPKGEKE
jgi:hypothetical protein